MVFVSSPEYKYWPISLQVVHAMLAFLCKKEWFFLIAGAECEVVKETFRPDTSQIPRMLAHVSKAIQGIPRLEGCSLTWDDAVMIKLQHATR